MRPTATIFCIVSCFHRKSVKRQQNTIMHEEDEIIRTKRILNSKKTVIWGFRRLSGEEADLLSSCTLLFRKVFLKFRSNVPPSFSGLWVRSGTHNPAVGDGTFLRNVREHRRNLRGARGQMPQHYFFLTQNNSFWLHRWKGENNKKGKYFLKDYLFCVKIEKIKNLRFKGEE